MPPKRKLVTRQEGATGIFPLSYFVAAHTDSVKSVAWSISRPLRSRASLLLSQRRTSRDNYALSLQQLQPSKSLLHPPESWSLARRPEPRSENTNPKTSTCKSDHGEIYHPHQDQLRILKTNAWTTDALDPSQHPNLPKTIWKGLKERGPASWIL